jgi:hypothetical protein
MKNRAFSFFTYHVRRYLFEGMAGSRRTRIVHRQLRHSPTGWLAGLDFDPLIEKPKTSKTKMAFSSSKVDSTLTVKKKRVRTSWEEVREPR